MLKKFLPTFFSLLISSLSSFSQTILPFTKSVDSMFVNLNKSYITTGILYDRIFPIAYLNMFNTSESDTSNSDHFTQAYYELYNCAYNSATFVIPDTVDSKIAQTLTSGYIPIGILNYNFNQIDTNAIVKNLITQINGLFYDVSGRPSSPYWLKQVSIVSPLMDSSFGLQVKFQTSSGLYLQNTGHIISTLQADFNNGAGLINVGANNSLTVNYSTYGIKVIKFIVKYTDNTQITTYASFKVVQSNQLTTPATATPCDKDDVVISTIPFTDYDNKTFKGQGNIHYYFATNTTCNGKVKKPIIVLDGFDPGDERKIDQLYDTYLNNSSRYVFADQLRSQGYDIVVLNFPNYTNELNQKVDGGADYIERNAFVLVTLINKLNAELIANGSPEKLVIVGPSMGGLISRYALAYMEKINASTNTRLWISFDSPNNGANISIGVQAFLKYYADNGSKDAKDKLEKKLRNPAAKQLLLHHINSGSYLAAGAPGFRDRFVQALTTNGLPGSNGFPQNLRKVALVDGSLDGTLQPNLPACTQALNVKVYLAKRILFIFKVRLFRVAQADIFTAGSYGNNCKVFMGSQIFNSSNDYFGYAPSNTINYDITPGSFTSTFKDFKDGPSFSSFGFLGQLIGPNYPIIGLSGTDTKITLYHDSHCFIPTKSALAFKGSNADFAENLYSRNLVSCAETPFDTYYGSTVNLEHVYITPAMGNFAIDEINKIQRQPSFNAAVPTNLTATLSWPSSNYYGYYLYFSPIPNVTNYYMEWFDITTNSLLNTYSSIYNGYFYYYFTNGHTYKYRLAATMSCGGFNFSNWSNPLLPPIATCSSGPLPSTLQQSRGCGNSGNCPYTNLSWPSITGATQYGVEYNVFNTSTGQSLPTGTITDSSPLAGPYYGYLTGTGWYIKYRVRVNCGSGFGNYSGWSATFFLQ